MLELFRKACMLYTVTGKQRKEARTVSELRDKIGGGLVSKMYVNARSGNCYHIGYVIGNYWCTAYMPVRILQ